MHTCTGCAYDTTELAIYHVPRIPVLSLSSLPMIGEIRHLLTDEAVEFEKELVEVQDWKKIPHHF